MTLDELRDQGLLVECEQNTDEWYEARKGKATSSKFKDATAGGKGKSRQTYMCGLLSERLTGNLVEHFKNKDMEWGSETEPLARISYTIETGNRVQKVGFVKYGDSMGASPDGFIGDRGMVQFKCPASHTHIAYLLENRMPPEHKKQIQGEMGVCGRDWSDFVSYDPRNPFKDIMIVRVERDDEFIAQLFKDLNLFVDDLLRWEEYFRNDTN